MDYRTFINYSLPVLTSVLAFLYLAKDWEAHKNSLRRLAVLLIILSIGVAGVINAFVNDAKARQDREEKRVLARSLETSMKNQENSTKQFISYIDRLSQGISELKTQVETESLKEYADNLQKELVSTKNELASTQKALKKPKIPLSFSFVNGDYDGNPTIITNLPVINNVIHIEFTVINNTEYTALDGEITVFICKACSFSKEPEGFRKLEDRTDRRIFSFQRILPKTHLKTLSLDVEVPSLAPSVDFAVLYRCTNCDTPTHPISGTGKIILLR